MNCDKKSMLLYAVTDRAWTRNETLLQQIEAALRGGATCIQLREKDLPYDAFLTEAIAVRELCRKYGVPFIVNDNVDIALESGADGVHVGQHDMKADNVRSLIGPDMILGVSAQTVGQAIDAEKSGADYLGVGAMFSTSTKLDADDVSIETLRDICSAVTIPVVAIGGITKRNLPELSHTGFAGAALVSAIFASDDIESECRELLQISREAVGIDIKGAVFDMDGTLLDSMSIWDTMGSRYLIERGIVPRPGLDYFFRALSLSEAAEYYRNEYGIEDSVEKIMSDINIMTEKAYMHEVLPKPDIIPVLDKLKALGVKMCVATATDRYLVEAALKRCGLLDYFCAIFTCTEIGVGKSDPLIFETALKYLGTEKDKTFIFEDSLFAIETAHKAQFPVAAVADASSVDCADRIRELSDIYIETFAQFGRILHV